MLFNKTFTDKDPNASFHTCNERSVALFAIIKLISEFTEYDYPTYTILQNTFLGQFNSVLHGNILK